MRSFKTIRDAEIAFAQMEERLRLLENGQNAKPTGQSVTGVSTEEIRRLLSNANNAVNDKVKQALEQDITYDSNFIQHQIYHEFLMGLKSFGSITTDDIFIGFSLAPPALWYLHMEATSANCLQLFVNWNNAGTWQLNLVCQWDSFDGTGLEATRINQHLLPNGNDVFDCGWPGQEWKSINTKTAYVKDASTPGSVPFIDASGNLDEDNTNLFWDAANKSLRIGPSLGIGNAPVLNTSLLINGDIRSAISGIAQAIVIGSGLTLKATANGDTLRAFVINPTFDDNGKTGVAHYAIFCTSTADSLMNGKFSKYNGIATEGFGLATIVDDVVLTAQAAAIGATNFTNANVAGLYDIVAYLEVTTLDATAGSIALVIGFTDDVGATTISIASIALTATGRYPAARLAVRLASGNITYAVNVTGAVNNARFALFASCLRLS